MGSGRLLAIDFGGTRTEIAVADVEGHVQVRRELRTNAERGATQIVDRALRAARELLDGHGSPLAVGVASMGITRENGVLIAPNVPGWEDLALPSLLQREFGGVPIRIENDVKAATFAELRWGALHGVQNGIYVNLGTGIAAGIVVGGRIVRGAHEAAGEIGFNTLSPTQQTLAAGGHAPLEEWAGGRALQQRLEGHFGSDIGTLFARYHGDDAVRQALDAYFDVAAFHLANLAIALDPSRVVLGAGLMRAKEVVLPALSGRISRLTPFPPEIVPAVFLTDAALRGAVALALDPLPAI